MELMADTMKKLNKIILMALVAVVCVSSTAISGCDVKIGDSESKKTSQSSVADKTSVPEKMLAEIKSKCDLGDSMKPLTAEQLKEMYNIDSEDMDSFVAIASEDSLVKDQIIIIRTMGESEACKIRDSLQKYYNKILDDSKSYLPDEYEKIKKCSVVKDGIYVSLIISDKVDEITEVYNSCDKI